MRYLREKAFNWLQERYDDDRILILVGPRQVGKSTLMKQLEEDRLIKGDKIFYITLEQFSYKELLNKDPNNIFQIIGPLVGEDRVTIIVDEVQYLKDPTHVLKYLYDTYKGKIKLIVTGSSAFYINEKFKDSLAGRKYIYEMQSLDFREFLVFKDYKYTSKTINKIEIEKLLPFFYEYITYGGYPAVVLAKDIFLKKELLKELAESYTKKDILDYHVSSQENYLRILKLLSAQIGSLLNVNTISNQLDIPRSTVERYIHIMEQSFHISQIKPYFNNKKKEIKKMPKVYFYDLGLRNHFVNNFEPFDIRIDNGMLLENIFYISCFVKYQGRSVTFWRTSELQEVDFIIDDLFAYEVKINKENVSKSKYSYFYDKYPNIKFSFVDINDCISHFLNI